MTRTFQLPAPTTVRQRLGFPALRRRAAHRPDTLAAAPHRSAQADRVGSEPTERDISPTWRQRVRYQW